MRKVYISGPISLGGTLGAKAIEKNIAQFARAASAVIESGDIVLDPTTLNPEDKSWLGYMREAIKMVCQADEILLLPGWEESRGAWVEVRLANDLGIPVKLL